MGRGESTYIYICMYVLVLCYFRPPSPLTFSVLVCACFLLFVVCFPVFVLCVAGLLVCFRVLLSVVCVVLSFSLCPCFPLSCCVF